MAEIVKGSPNVQPLLRKFRQPIYDEEQVGGGALVTTVALFARRRGETDNAGRQKTARDTNLLANGALGARQEFYLVGFTLNMDVDVLAVSPVDESAAGLNSELLAYQSIFTDGFFTFQFGRQQPLLEIPADRIPMGVAPCGYLQRDQGGMTGATDQLQMVLSNGVPSVREFYDSRLRKARPRHIQPEQSFSADLNWQAAPGGGITLGNDGNVWFRVMVYAIGILLSAL